MRTVAVIQAPGRSTRLPCKVLRERGDPPASTVDCGANVGINLQALQRIRHAGLTAVEPNGKARATLVPDGVLPAARVHDATLDALSFPDASVDLAFTSDVLIHVPPKRRERACRKVHQGAREGVLAIEYFARNPEAIVYRGHQNLLLKHDIGSHHLDLFLCLVPVVEGFHWHRTTGYDNATWCPFRNRQA